MVSPFESNIHLRLVKNFPGPPRSGAMVPSASLGGAVRHVMLHWPRRGEETIQLTAIPTGGGLGRAAGAGVEPPLEVGRSKPDIPPPQPAATSAIMVVTTTRPSLRIVNMAARTLIAWWE